MKKIELRTFPENTKIAIIVSEFNGKITQGLYEGAQTRLQELNCLESNIQTAWVPGVVELPLLAQQFARTKQYDAIICFGSVIQGETDHYDYVCQQVSYGCQKVALEYDVPVIFGVLTTQTYAQAIDRIGGSHGHKGVDAVNAALQMIDQLQQLKAI